MRGDSGYAYLPAGQAELEFSKYEARIKALEKLNATLAAEIDRTRLVMAVARRWNACEYGSNAESVAAMRLSEVINDYEASLKA